MWSSINCMWSSIVCDLQLYVIFNCMWSSIVCDLQYKDGNARFTAVTIHVDSACL